MYKFIYYYIMSKKKKGKCKNIHGKLVKNNMFINVLHYKMVNI